MLKIIEINDTQFDTVVLKASLPVVLHVTSPECIICKTMTDRIAEAGKEAASQILFLSLNINENRKWQDYNVRVVPTLLYFKGGKLVATHDKFPDTEEIRSQINVFLKKEGAAAHAAEQIKAAMDLEYAASRFYEYMSSNAKNGRMKERFRQIREELVLHSDALQGKLRELSGELYEPSENPKFSEFDDMRPQSFSLLGALKMAMKFEEKLIDLYKKLKKNKPKIDDELFRKFSKEESLHLKQLKEEMKFVHNKELLTSMESPGYETWLNKVFE